MWYGAVAVGLDEGGFRVTLVDKGNSICRTVYDIPGDVTVSSVAFGDYCLDIHGLFSPLTDREQGILEAAVEPDTTMPRRAIDGNLTIAVSLLTGKVGKHLRKVEK